MKRLRLGWPLWLPMLHLFIELPFITVRLAMLTVDYASEVYYYGLLSVKVGRWSTEVGLFDTKLRRLMKQERIDNGNRTDS